MKKLFLLLAAGLPFAMASAQTSKVTLLNSSMSPQGKAVTSFNGKPVVRTPAGKTTASHSYWFSFDDANYTATASASLYPIYNDTSLYVSGATTPYFWNIMGLGASFDPTSTAFQPDLMPNLDLTPSDFIISNTNAYSVDSVAIIGRYQRRPYNNYVDTLNIYITTAASGSVSTLLSQKDAYFFTNIGIPDSTFHFATAVYDSAGNTIPGVMKVQKILDSTAFADSDATSGLHSWNLALPSIINATAGQKLVVYQQYKSGNNYRFGIDIDSANVWEVLTYELNGSGTYPTQRKSDYNSGLISTAYTRYDIDTQAFIYSGKQWLSPTYWYGASAGFDDPYFGFHITCSTCTLLDVQSVSPVSDVRVAPNPASTELNVSFNMAQQGSAAVTLTNMIGQVVASKTVNTTNAHVVFNTSALPSGVYIYTVEANGQRTTGRVSIAH